jgi:hypothetical protein
MPFDWRRITDEEKGRITDSLKIMVDGMRARMDSALKTAPANVSVPTYDVAPASSLPDYFPPVRDGAARADADGNLWILPTTSASAQGGLLYDVVNRKGELFERVQLPAGCALSAFSPGRVVYLACVATGLERRRVVVAAQ